MSSFAKHGMIIAALAILFCSNASAQTQPAEQPGPISKFANGLKPSNWKVPKFSLAGFKKKVLPTQQEKARMTDHKDNLFKEVGQTARKSWARTKEVLNPKKLLPTNFMGGNQNNQPAKAKKKGFFSSLFDKEEESAPKRTTTVNDFLSQDRVGQ